MPPAADVAMSHFFFKLLDVRLSLDWNIKYSTATPSIMHFSADAFLNLGLGYGRCWTNEQLARTCETTKRTRFMKRRFGAEPESCEAMFSWDNTRFVLAPRHAQGRNTFIRVVVIPAVNHANIMSMVPSSAGGEPSTQKRTTTREDQHPTDKYYYTSDIQSPREESDSVLVCLLFGRRRRMELTNYL